jgi:hypothetical protein
MKTIIYSMIFLLLILLIFVLNACGRKDYALITTWYVINETDSVISFARPSTLAPSIKPFDTLFYYSDSEGPKEPDPKRVGILSQQSDIVYYGVGLCDTQELSQYDINNINNYEIKVISKRKFEYIYRFTPEMLANAKPCN